MPEGDPQFEPGKARQTMAVLRGALLVSQLVYVGILLGGFAPVQGQGSATAIAFALAAVALGVAAGAHVFWRKATGAGLALHAERPPLATAFTHYLIAWMLDESIAIYGLVLGLLGHGPSVWGWFSAAGLALLLLHRPASDPL